MATFRNWMFLRPKCSARNRHLEQPVFQFYADDLALRQQPAEHHGGGA
jgi:hypothetical protein